MTAPRRLMGPEVGTTTMAAATPAAEVTTGRQRSRVGKLGPAAKGRRGQEQQRLTEARATC